MGLVMQKLESLEGFMVIYLQTNGMHARCEHARKWMNSRKTAIFMQQNLPPMLLKITVPFSRADWTCGKVIRASLNEDPVGWETAATFFVLL